MSVVIHISCYKCAVYELQICDSELNIIHVDACYGGAAHDSFVWNQSPIKSYLERLENTGLPCWLLGENITHVHVISLLLK